MSETKALLMYVCKARQPHLSLVVQPIGQTPAIDAQAKGVTQRSVGKMVKHSNPIQSSWLCGKGKVNWINDCYEKEVEGVGDFSGTVRARKEYWEKQGVGTTR